MTNPNHLCLYNGTHANNDTSYCKEGGGGGKDRATRAVAREAWRYCEW